MAVEQLPGDCPLKLVQGDDFIIQFNLPFDITSYTWECKVHKRNANTISVPIAASVTSSVLGVIQTSFYASITSILDTTIPNEEHSWYVRYTSDQGLQRTLLSGILEVV